MPILLPRRNSSVPREVCRCCPAARFERCLDPRTRVIRGDLASYRRIRQRLSRL
jgi:hypothetical protein